MSADNDAGGHNDIAAERSGVCKGGRGVDGVNQIEADGVDAPGESAARPVIADRDHDSVAAVLLGELGQVANGTEHGDAVDPSAVDVGVVVEEANDVVLGRLKEDIEDDPSVSSGAENQDAFGLARVIWENSHKCIAGGSIG